MWVILSIILAILILILFAPLKLVLSFKNTDISAKLSLAGIPVYVKKSDSAKKENKSSKKNVDETIEDKVKSIEKDALSFGEKIELLVTVFKTTAKLAGRYVTIKDLKLAISVGTGDAASTAVGTGILWAAVYNLIGIVGRIIPIDSHSVEISPDYGEENYQADGVCIFKSRVAYIIIILITILLNINPKKGKED